MSNFSRDAAQARLEEIDRRNGRQSLYYLAKFILGYRDLEPKPHLEVCEFAQAVFFYAAESTAMNQSGALDMEPRGAFKTTIFSQALPISLAINDPNIRILLTSSVLQNSIDNLTVVKNHFANNQKLRHLFGDYEGSYWVTEEATVSKRTNYSLKEPTFRAASIEKSQVGPHYNVIIADDLVTKENSETPEGRKKISDYVKLLFSLLEPGGVIMFVGTSYHYEDVYAELQNKDKYPELTVRIRKASSAGRAEGELYFPQRLTREFLLGQMRRQGREIYASQYDNDPAPEGEDSDFQRSWFKPMRRDSIPERRFTYITIDPGGKDKGRDDWVFFLAHAFESRDIYFDRYISRLFRVDAAWDLLFEWVKQHNPMAVGLEVAGGQKYLVESLEKEMRERNHFFNVIPLTHACISKTTRIRTLQPRYRAGAIYHSEDMGGLEEQLIRHPKGRDDIADAAAAVLELAQFPATKSLRKTEIKSIDHFFELTRRGMFKKKPAHPVLGTYY